MNFKQNLFTRGFAGMVFVFESARISALEGEGNHHRLFTSLFFTWRYPDVKRKTSHRPLCDCAESNKAHWAAYPGSRVNSER